MTGYITRPGGVRLGYTKDSAEAAKAAVLIIHGFSEHGGYYDYAAGALSGAGYDAYRLDCRGHGRSADSHEVIDGHTLDEYVDDVDALAELAKSETGRPLFVLGHSMGALIALAYGIKHRDRLAGQITTGASCKKPVEFERMSAEEIRLAARMTVKTSDIPGLLRAQDADDPYLVKSATMGFLYEMFARGAEYVIGHAGEYACPILMLHGQQDKMAAFNESFRFLSECASPDKTLVLRPKANHCLLAEENEREYAVGCIVGWLDRRVV